MWAWRHASIKSLIVCSRSAAAILMARTSWRGSLIGGYLADAGRAGTTDQSRKHHPEQHKQDANRHLVAHWPCCRAAGLSLSSSTETLGVTNFLEQSSSTTSARERAGAQGA